MIVHPHRRDVIGSLDDLKKVHVMGDPLLIDVTVTGCCPLQCKLQSGPLSKFNFIVERERERIRRRFT